MKKRILSVLLCAAMVATMAVGCGSKKEGNLPPRLFAGGFKRIEKEEAL